MNSNKTAIRFLFLCALCALAVPAPAQDTGPAQVIRDFYAWYVPALEGEGDPFTGGQAEIEKYITQRFRKEIEKERNSEDGLGADPFLSAQDFDKEWARNVTVSEPEIKGERATADVDLKGAEMGTHKLRVTLAKENGAWKIDGVEGK